MDDWLRLGPAEACAASFTQSLYKDVQGGNRISKRAEPRWRSDTHWHWLGEKLQYHKLLCSVMIPILVRHIDYDREEKWLTRFSTFTDLSRPPYPVTVKRESTSIWLGQRIPLKDETTTISLHVCVLLRRRSARCVFLSPFFPSIVIRNSSHQDYNSLHDCKERVQVCDWKNP